MSLTIKTDHVTSGRKDVDPHGRLRAAKGRGRMGFKITKLEEDGNSTDEHVPSGDLPQPPQILKYARKHNNTSGLDFARLNGLNARRF